MNVKEKHIHATVSTQADKDKNDPRKYNFYRKPSIKKKNPEVKQTLTSYKRMLKANPLLKYEMEGKDLSALTKQVQNSVNSQNKGENASVKKLVSEKPREKQSLQPKFNAGKPLIATVQRSQSLKNPPKLFSAPLKKELPSIISGSKQFVHKNLSSTNVSRQSNCEFNTSTSRFLSSTRLENNCSKIRPTKDTKMANNNYRTKTLTQDNSYRTKTLTQDNSISSSSNHTNSNHREGLKKNKTIRRSLSAQHFEMKKGELQQGLAECLQKLTDKPHPNEYIIKRLLDCLNTGSFWPDTTRRKPAVDNDVNQINILGYFQIHSGNSVHKTCRDLGKPDRQNCFTQVKLTQSLENISNLKSNALQHDISPIAEGSRESSIVFKTPSAYERRSIARFTPKSILVTRRSLYRPATPLPSLNDLQKRLNEWLLKRGKSLSSFHHLKCFGILDMESEIIDEENKENIEVNQDLDKGSYEELKIQSSNCSNNSESKTSKPLALNEENAESIAKAALEDLLKLIQDGYPGPQCEGWLELIRQKYRKLEEEPQYWECRAAIEQSRGNISNAVQCYRTAIVQGAEIQSVDESLDILLQKFSLLNINTKDVDTNEQSITERTRIVRDARNVFKSSIIQFAVQEKKFKKNDKIETEKKFVATPVRRSTRLSRSAYTSTPGIKICSSLQELDTSDREMLDFKKNKALF